MFMKTNLLCFCWEKKLPTRKVWDGWNFWTWPLCNSIYRI